MGGGKTLSDIIQSFAAQDERVVAIDKENGGVSSARNLGIEKARGKWIVFVDPDDRLEPFYLQALYDAVADGNALLGIGGFKEYYAGQNVWCDHTLTGYKKNELLKDCYSRLDSLVLLQPWNKIFNAGLLRRHGLQFDETKSFGEDHFFCLQAFNLIDTIAIAPDSGYRYIRNVQSATQKYHNKFKAGLEDVDACERKLLERFGMTEQELEGLYVKKAPSNAYICVINYFKIGNGLSFRQKVTVIKDEILGDKHLMMALRQHRFHREGINVTLCTHLLLSRQAWLVAMVFQLLFVMKNHFMGLFNWYDAHWSGKLKT